MLIDNTVDVSNHVHVHVSHVLKVQEHVEVPQVASVVDKVVNVPNHIQLYVLHVSKVWGACGDSSNCSC